MKKSKKDMPIYLNFEVPDDITLGKLVDIYNAHLDELKANDITSKTFVHLEPIQLIDGKIYNHLGNLLDTKDAYYAALERQAAWQTLQNFNMMTKMFGDMGL